jgi:hypothetical protein
MAMKHLWDKSNRNLDMKSLGDRVFKGKGGYRWMFNAVSLLLVMHMISQCIPFFRQERRLHKELASVQEKKAEGEQSYAVNCSKGTKGIIIVNVLGKFGAGHLLFILMRI